MRCFESFHPLWWSEILTSARQKKFVFLEFQMVVTFKVRLRRKTEKPELHVECSEGLERAQLNRCCVVAPMNASVGMAFETYAYVNRGLAFERTMVSSERISLAGS